MRPNKFLEKIAIRSERISLASSRVATRSERVIGPLTVIDQNRRRIVGTAAGLVDATKTPLATVDTELGRSLSIPEPRPVRRMVAVIGPCPGDRRTSPLPWVSQR